MVYFSYFFFFWTRVFLQLILHLVKLTFVGWACILVYLAQSRSMPVNHASLLLEPREDSWEPLVQQGDQTSQSHGNQSWIFIGRTDAEAEAPILRPPDTKSRLIGKDLDAGKDWGQEDKGATEDKMVEWHHWLNRFEFEQTPGDSEGRETWCAAVHGVTVRHDLGTEQVSLKVS